MTVSERFPGVPSARTARSCCAWCGEALVNARRHSGAQTISVDVRASKTRLWAEVSDDGSGFEAAADGTGILGMRERAAIIGGELLIRSAVGVGTRVRLTIELGDDTAAPLVRVLLVEDHAAVRQALAAMFAREPDFAVVGQAATLAEARSLLSGVDVAVVDLGLPDGDGADLIRSSAPSTRALRRWC